MATDSLQPGLSVGEPANVFLVPGHRLADLLQPLFDTAGIAVTSTVILALAVIAWLFSIFLVALLLRRLFGAATVIRNMVQRWIDDAVNGARIRVLSRAHRLDWRRRQRAASIQEEIELDELDHAVLDHAAALPSGHSIAVVELAESLGERPSRVQDSLDKLRSHHLVQPLMGSTDGFGDYCLTDTGSWYVGANRGIAAR